MKTLIACLIVLSVLACKKNTSPEQVVNTNTESESQHKSEDQKAEDSLVVFSEKNLEKNQENTTSIKREQLIKAKDDKSQLQELVVSKKLYKEDDLYIIDYQYPYLNETIDPGYSAFNSYIKENYLDIEKTQNQILEDKELLCDTLKIKKFRDKRIIDYKIYNAKNDLISVVLYKENYYSGMKHSTYLFDCINFDLNNHNFVYFDTFFETGSEEEVYRTINTIIKESINSGELYYDCWELSKGDFQVYKNNFVVDDDMIKFYFDDCIICPSYTGTYFIEIPTIKIMHLLKKYNAPPEVS